MPRHTRTHYTTPLLACSCFGTHAQSGDAQKVLQVGVVGVGGDTCQHVTRPGPLVHRDDAALHHTACARLCFWSFRVRCFRGGEHGPAPAVLAWTVRARDLRYRELVCR